MDGSETNCIPTYANQSFNSSSYYHFTISDQCNDLSTELQRVVGEMECGVEVRKTSYRSHIDNANHSIEQHTSASELVERRAFEVCIGLVTLVLGRVV